MPISLKTSMGITGHGFIFSGGLSQNVPNFDHNGQGIVPKDINFDGFTMTRGNYPVSYFGIHPG
ncbi:hypothetical protein CY0110_18892 [Crocosphaera chwakensis CCY0110]|uniref:Uncharacterized protein n=1 Tax=Crocosphaera chwakensis CCY0110 TaxID=391612 RepID=A3IJB0_9CHRO|nr:hypothetical protein CY0110_18892 [Crocosphaera chwakensis CCY0110]